MARDTVEPSRETKVDDEAIRTVTSSANPPSEILDNKNQKEAAPPVTVTSVPSSDSGTINDARTGKQKKAEVLQLMALFWSIFYVGCGDGGVGPLLPRIQQVYHVSNFPTSAASYPNLIE